MLLALSIIAIIIGPIAVSWLKYNQKVDSFLFAFVLVSVGGILFLDVLPDLWGSIHWWIVPSVLLGFFGPGFIEVSFKNAAEKAHATAIILGVFGLVLHSLLDGAAISTSHIEHLLPYAIVLHRLVVGLSIWWIIQPIWGNKATIAVFSFTIAATVLGYFFGQQWLESISSTSHAIQFFQAVICGTLLHVIIHRPHVDDHGKPHKHTHYSHDDTHHHGHEHHQHGFVISNKPSFIIGLAVGLILLALLHYFH